MKPTFPRKENATKVVMGTHPGAELYNGQYLAITHSSDQLRHAAVGLEDDESIMIHLGDNTQFYLEIKRVGDKLHLSSCGNIIAEFDRG